MAQPRESSAIIRFIHRQEQPILTAEHAIETQVVRSPYLPVARRSRLGPLLIAGAVVAAFAVVAWFALAGGEGERKAAAAPAPTETQPAAAPAVPAVPAVPVDPPPAEPVVIAMPDDDETAAEQADPLPEPAFPDPVPQPGDAADQITDADLAPQTTPRLKRRVVRAAEPAPKPSTRAARRRTKVAPPPDMGSKGVLMIASKPPCRILVNDRDTGLTTPQRDIQLVKGRHKITLVNREHGIESSLSVNIRPGKRVRVVRDLTDRMKSKRR